MASSLTKIWGNTDDCAEYYICASALYLTSVMSKCYSVIIDHGISATIHRKEVVGGINDIDKNYIQQLMFNIQLTGSKTFY